MFRATAQRLSRLFAQASGRAQDAVPIAETSAAGGARARTLGDKVAFGARETLLCLAAAVGAGVIDDVARERMAEARGACEGAGGPLDSALDFLTRTNLSIHGSTVALYALLRRFNPVPACGEAAVRDHLLLFRRSPATLGIFVGLSFYVYGALSHELWSSARLEALQRNSEARAAHDEAGHSWTAEAVLREAAGRVPTDRVAATAAVAPVCEEAVYRGMLLQRLAAGAGGLVPGILLSSVIFSNMHELPSVTALLRTARIECPHRFFEIQQRLHRLNLDLLELVHGKGGRWDEALRRFAAFQRELPEAMRGAAGEEAHPARHVLRFRDPRTGGLREAYLSSMTTDDAAAAKEWSRAIVEHIEGQPRGALYASYISERLSHIAGHPGWSDILADGQIRIDSGIMYALSFIAAGGRLWVPVVLHARHNLGCIAVDALVGGSAAAAAAPAPATAASA
eukprot:tig00021312_g20041.t1